MGKYVKGDRINCVQELVEICVNQRKSVYFINKARNCYFVENQQLRWLTEWVSAGVFYQAVPKEKEVM